MRERRFSLLTDGSSDRWALLPLIGWLLHEKLPSVPVHLEWADLSRAPRRQKGLVGKIQSAIDNYPCDVLFVHRDGETEPRATRVAEINSAVSAASLSSLHVCVVTVRMQEAWLLLDEYAIRSAAGNPNGAVALDLPKIQRLENLADPKHVLHELLRQASELSGRRLKKFSASASAYRVAELTQNWHLLRNLRAFVEFESELDLALSKLDGIDPE